PQWAVRGAKTAVAANLLGPFPPGVRLRLSATNRAAQDYVLGSTFDGETERETAQTTARTYVNWQLRLELKL
nr:hypothetical protein [Piscinibacter sp.]